MLFYYFNGGIDKSLAFSLHINLNNKVSDRFISFYFYIFYPNSKFYL